MWNLEMENVEGNIQVELEFLDHTFTIEVPKDIDLEELFEIIEKFVFENPEISIDLKSLAKTILDTEYYNLILKQNKNGIDTTIGNFNEIQIGIPLKLELESDDIKKRYFTKRHMKSTLKHIDSIAINEFTNMFALRNIALFKQSLLNLAERYPLSITEDIMYIDKPFTKEQLKTFTNEVLDFMEK